MTFEVNDEKHAELSSAMVRVEDFIAIEDVDDVCAGWNQEMVRKSVKIILAVMDKKMMGVVMMRREEKMKMLLCYFFVRVLFVCLFCCCRSAWCCRGRGQAVEREPAIFWRSFFYLPSQAHHQQNKMMQYHRPDTVTIAVGKP